MPNSEEPSRTHEHALSQLRYIRSTMDGATRFTAVPGAGTAVIGVTAFVAAGLGQMQSTRDAMLSVWVGEAVVAGGIGLVALIVKSRSAGIDLTRGAARKFVLALMPSAVCAAAIALALAVQGQTTLIPAVWLTGYGSAVVAAGTHSVSTVPIMGAAFVVAGLAALFVAPQFHNALLALAFGGIHLTFGMHIARHHGG
ncbi:MAG TPA: hypothetical protein VL379_00635 [Pseudomonadales bacterium]|nr:hypothetical protein [Pseudomonadales bacterium]